MQILPLLVQLSELWPQNPVDQHAHLPTLRHGAGVVAAGLLLPHGKPRRLFGEDGLVKALGDMVGEDGGVAGFAVSLSSASAEAVTVSPDTPVMHVADIFTRKKINRAPVVDEEGRMVGIVSRADVVRSSTLLEGK